jgi:hypothetical protein
VLFVRKSINKFEKKQFLSGKMVKVLCVKCVMTGFLGLFQKNGTSIAVICKVITKFAIWKKHYSPL